jgi:hypothetical protein
MLITTSLPKPTWILEMDESRELTKCSGRQPRKSCRAKLGHGDEFPTAISTSHLIARIEPMIAEAEITASRHIDPLQEIESSRSLNLVAVASGPLPRGNDLGRRLLPQPVSFKVGAFGSEAQRIRYTRIAPQAVGLSAAWMIQRQGGISVRDRLAGAAVMAPRGVAELPQTLSGILSMLGREEFAELDHQAIASAIVTLRSADAVIVGPLSPDDAQAPGLLPHLADLASGAYRALRPPVDLIAQSAFGQLARRFQFIQMSHHDARWLGAGAVDIGVLAQSLRHVQGGQGEFAITAFRSHGVLWAGGQWWEIDPIGDNVDEARAGAAFTAAWVVARCVWRASVAKALSFARSATLNSAVKG